MKEPILVIKRGNGLYGVCPECSRKLIICNYCPNCGIKLDWSKWKNN